MKCKEIREDGTRCQAMAMEREELCVYHSKSETAMRMKEEGKKVAKGTTSTGFSRR